jgi:hypothetical protein
LLPSAFSIATKKTSCKGDLSLAPILDKMCDGMIKMVFNATLAFQSSPKSSYSNSTAPPLLSLQTSSQSLDPFPTKIHTDQSHVASVPHAFMSQACPSCLTPEIKTPSFSAPVPDSGAPVPNLQRDLAVACSPCMRWDFRRDGAGRRVPRPPNIPQFCCNCKITMQ